MQPEETSTSPAPERGDPLPCPFCRSVPKWTVRAAGPKLLTCPRFFCPGSRPEEPTSVETWNAWAGLFTVARAARNLAELLKSADLSNPQTVEHFKLFERACFSLVHAVEVVEKLGVLDSAVKP